MIGISNHNEKIEMEHREGANKPITKTTKDPMKSFQLMKYFH